MQLNSLFIAALLAVLATLMMVSAQDVNTTTPTASPTPIPCDAYGKDKVSCKANPACGWRGVRKCTLVCKYKDQPSCESDLRCKWKVDDSGDGSCKVVTVVNPGKGHGKGNGGKGKGRLLDEDEDDDEEDDGEY